MIFLFDMAYLILWVFANRNSQLSALAACTAEEATPEIVEVTRVVTETVVEEGETVEVTRVVIETETVTEVVTEVVTETEFVTTEPIIYNSYNGDPEPRSG